MVHGRVEELPRVRPFDFVLGRAVTALPAFVAWTRPYVRRRDEAPPRKDWGIEPGILYIKSDDVSDDLVELGIQRSEVSIRPIADLLVDKPAGDEPSDQERGYSSVLHVPARLFRGHGGSGDPF